MSGRLSEFEKKVYLISKDFSHKFMLKCQDDPDYLETLDIKNLLEANNIPYELIASIEHIGDPKLRMYNQEFVGMPEIFLNIEKIKSYFLPN